MCVDIVWCGSLIFLIINEVVMFFRIIISGRFLVLVIWFVYLLFVVFLFVI